MNAVMIVLPDGRRYPELLRSLRDAGAHSAAVYENEGVDFVFWRGLRASMTRHWDEQTGTGKTVLAIAPDALTTDVVAAAEQVLGGFSGPSAGMIVAWSLGHFGCYQGDARAGALVGGRS